MIIKKKYSYLKYLYVGSIFKYKKSYPMKIYRVEKKKFPEIDLYTVSLTKYREKRVWIIKKEYDIRSFNFLSNDIKKKRI